MSISEMALLCLAIVNLSALGLLGMLTLRLLNRERSLSRQILEIQKFEDKLIRIAIQARNRQKWRG